MVNFGMDGVQTTYDVRYLSKWLLSHILGRFVLTFSKNHLLELKRDLLLVKHHGNTFRAGRERGAVEFNDHDEWDVSERFCELS